MNHRYRKKPVVIEAFQMTRDRRRDNREWPAWLHEAWQKDPGEGCLFSDPYPGPNGEGLCLGTLEGVQRVVWGAWIIRGVVGELYTCKNDIFMATYEAVDVPDEEEAS